MYLMQTVVQLVISSSDLPGSQILSSIQFFYKQKIA